VTSAPLATLACGGQPAVPKPGVAASVSTSVSSLAAAIGTAIAGVPGEILLTIIAGQQFNVSAMCAAGDPGDVTLTPQDLLDASIDTFAPAGVAATQKIKQWFTHLIFPVWCQCSDGTHPPASVVTKPPAETSNPNMLPGPMGANCWNASTRVPPNQSESQWVWTMIVPPLAPMPNPPAPQNLPPITLPLPLPVSVEFRQTVYSDMGVGTHDCNVNFWDASGLYISTGQIISASAATDQRLIVRGPVPANARYMATYGAWQGSGTLSGTATGEMILYCTGQSPSAPEVPCCPPDPSLDARLTYLTNLVMQLAGMLQPAVDNLVDGAAHGPFSGTGSVLLEAECAAVRVDVLSDLSTWPKNPGTPNYFWSLGFITSYAETNPLKGWRLVYSSQTFPLQPYTDMIGWTLPDGVQIRITEQLGASAAG